MLRSVDQSRQILERSFSEHRKHIIGLVNDFGEATETKLQALEKSQTAQARQAGESLELFRSQLADIRAVAKLMEGDLRKGAENGIGRVSSSRRSAANSTLPWAR